MHRLSSLLRRGGVLGLALLLVLLVTWGVSAAGSTTVYLPVVSKQPTPTPEPPLPSDYSVSYYVQTTSSSAAYDKGCKLGQTDAGLAGAQDRLVILDFGQPWYEDGQYGTIVFRVLGQTDFIFASMNSVKEMAQNFAAGYWSCSGSDKQSHLTLGIGTSNYLRADMAYTSNAYEHGKLWAQMVLSVNSWLKSAGYAGQVYAAGANDIEPSWATAALTRNWVRGFDDYDNSSAIYYNYGACDGCPQSYDSNIANWSYMPSDWEVEDAWYVSWGVQPAWVIPEIYLSTEANARQWQVLSKFAKNFKGARIDYSGVMTQYGACEQRGGCTFSNPTRDTMNTPQEGWNQLWYRTYNDPDTRMDFMRWITDIRYWTK